MKRAIRIGIEAYLWGQAGSYRQSGVSAYVRHLVRGLAGVSLPGEALVYLPFDCQADFPTASHLRGQVSPIPLLRPAQRILWEHTIFPFLLWKDRVRLLHATMNVAPWWSPCPVVVTILDLAYLRYPHVHPPGRRLYLDVMTRLTVRQARAIVAISQYTREEIERLLHVPPARIHIIYLGVDADLRPLPRDQVETFRRQRGLPERYLLYLGNLEPRKNLPRLVQAYARIRKCGVPLVLAGARGWGYAELFELVEKLGLSPQVLFPGFVPRQELPLWYNGAEALVYPSLYEGFGLPPLEAMACGTPVLVSTAASLPEVVGEAGLQVSPDDVEGLAKAMRRLLQDEDLRADLRQRGLMQARRFTWEQMARETAGLYQKLLER
jgi:glycosyltransferase involved in cell wall biosynthesis